MMWRFIVLAVLWLVTGIASAQSAPVGFGTDVDGQTVDLLKGGHTRAVVLFFVASDCPISNQTLPEMKRVQAEFAGQGVSFWFVYPNATQTPQSIHEHMAAFGVDGTALVDPHGLLGVASGAKWTPESVVMVPEKSGLRTVYVGRIDDRYVGIGRERPHATQHDLEDAVSAVLAGHKPKPPGGPTVGCGIVRAQ